MSPFFSEKIPVVRGYVRVRVRIIRSAKQGQVSLRPSDCNSTTAAQPRLPTPHVGAYPPACSYGSHIAMHRLSKNEEGRFENTPDPEP
jgi:hypothetical protein